MSGWPDPTPKFDERDQELVDQFQASLNEHRQKRPDVPGVGDWIKFADGLVLRVSHVWDDGVQYTYGGSFSMGDGYVSYSGGLEPVIKLDTLTLTDEVKQGAVWIFHHNHWKAHNSVHTAIDFRVYESTANTHTRWCSKCKEVLPGAHWLEHKTA
jgi:hypothetical protein